MAAWPDLAMLKAALGVTHAEADSRLQLALDAAKEQVQIDVLGAAGALAAPITTPSSSLAQAALLLAVSVMKAPDAPFGVAAIFDTGGIYVARDNPNYWRLLVGQRQSFGVA